MPRDTREGWPMLNVETEANEMGTQEVHKGVRWFLPWLVRWAVVPVQEIFCPAQTALFGLVQNIIFLAVHFFTSFVPIAQQARQSCRVAYLLICFSGYDTATIDCTRDIEK